MPPELLEKFKKKNAMKGSSDDVDAKEEKLKKAKMKAKAHKAKKGE